jgi:hypothetical protein
MNICRNPSKTLGSTMPSTDHTHRGSQNRRDFVIIELGNVYDWPAVMKAIVIKVHVLSSCGSGERIYVPFPTD